MSSTSLLDLLKEVANDKGRGRIICYTSEDKPTSFSYLQLLEKAQTASWSLQNRISGIIKHGSPILLHFTGHWDNILWFWAVMIAGYVPVMATSLPNDEYQRKIHLNHLRDTMKSSLCLTRKKNIAALGQDVFTNTIAVETINPNGQEIQSITTLTTARPEPSDTAVILLTSGSTGNSKLVCLSHSQILAALSGKTAIAPLPRKCFMNWISLDHVASLIEFHLLAIMAHGEQVHVQSADILGSPTRFLDIIHTHRVARTFAPNFFLAKLRAALDLIPDNLSWDLSCLHCINSGGEANVAQTCEDLSSILVNCGAPENVIVPGFGMTETCAGAIFNTRCPHYEQEKQLEYASLGLCMPGARMRITDGTPLNTCMPEGEAGSLELTGPVVFKKYLNDPIATAKSFTWDGWFITGDRGYVDENGCLNLLGRSKDTIIVNGMKYDPHTIESALDASQIPGLTPSFNCCFSSLPRGKATEEICVVYLPTFAMDDTESLVKTSDAIANIIIMTTGARPRIIPLDSHLLQKSALGKLSRARIKASYEKGDYQAYQTLNDESIKESRHFDNEEPQDDLERKILTIFRKSLSISDPINIHTRIFDLGITSIELIKLKKDLEIALALDDEIPITTLLINQSVRAFKETLRKMQTQHVYDPVIMLSNSGKKSPLWFVHPGVGEVLVFLNLANLIKDRPVFALRARGFNEGETPFNDIEETVRSYHAAIKKKQPNGPYAIAGYSYGAMLVFEISKVFESQGDTVAFVGSFNLPPHIKTRMRQLKFNACLLHLSYFLNLISETCAKELADEVGSASKENVLEIVMKNSDPVRLAELALSKEALFKWAHLATSLQNMAVDYEPSGSVACLDCFYCVPLQALAISKQEWLDEHLSKWEDFARSEVRFHGVGGAHYTMLSPEHVVGFQETLQRALEERGL